MFASYFKEKYHRNLLTFNKNTTKKLIMHGGGTKAKSSETIHS
jgi:hypothetical protein